MTGSTSPDTRNFGTGGNRPDAVPTVLLLRRGWEGVRLLFEAYLYATEVGCDLWDFAVEMDCLQQAGCTRSELRWLVCKEYIDHGIESTLPGEPKRTFRQIQGPRGLTFGRRSCFVLTTTGLAFAQTTVGDRWASSCEQQQTAEFVHPAPAAVERKPQWDGQRQELRLGDAIVKQFKVPAANQERILAAFDEEGWPVRIDDPLPPNSDQNPKRRLHDTINSLNRNQKQNLLRFTGDGSGQGIRWELVVDDDG